MEYIIIQGTDGPITSSCIIEREKADGRVIVRTVPSGTLRIAERNYVGTLVEVRG